MAEKKSTRIAYGEALAKLGAVDEKVLVCDADLAHATMTAFFADQFPDRFYNFGIAESNMMTSSAALAHCGYTVFASTFAVFGAGRAFEQVRNAICYTKANVKIGCSHAGPSCGEDGGSHQAVPVYIRTGRLPTDICTCDETPFEIGKANTLRDGNDIAIIACGIMVPQALLAAETLAKKGIHARVIDMHTIKPLDVDAVMAAAKDCGAIVTAEEHSIYGGLGSAVAEVIADGQKVAFERVGIQDQFGTSGKPQALFEHFGLTDHHIVEACERVLARK